MGIDAIFNTASSALAAQRVAIDITGQNIANVNTPGYSRQRPVMESGPSTTHNGFSLGNGVHVAAVQRLYDAVINQQLNDGNSTLGNNQAKMKTLQQLEPFLNEISGNTLGDAMQKFSDAWQSLSVNPAGVAERQTVLGRGTILVDTFHQINDGIRNVQSFANSSIDGVATDITIKAREIASLNVQIRQAEMVAGNANELRDQRDFLIQEMSKLAGISAAEQADGTVTITLPGGEPLVVGNRYAEVYTNPVATADPNLPNPSNQILVTGLGFPPTRNLGTDIDITATVGGSNNTKGEIGGLLYVRDTVLPGYLAKLDETAYNLAWQTNTQHAVGWNLNNATGIDFFSPVIGTAPPAGTAAFAGYSSSRAAIGIRMAISSTNEIAAADVNPLVGGIGNNKNAILMGKLASQQVSFSGGVLSTTASYFNTVVSSVGVDVQGAKNLTAQNENFMRQLSNLRESVAGVSLDEELTSLIKYQKAFEGASRVINTATQMLDTVLNLVR